MNQPLPPLARRFVLGGAILGALVVAFGPYAPAVEAGERVQGPGLATALMVAQADVGTKAAATQVAAKIR